MKIKDIKNRLKIEAEILIYDELSSSNTEAKHLALNGASEFTTVIAKSQTHGKGRLGRSFISNSENGLYMSIILKPNTSPGECVDITALTAVAVMEAINESTDVKSSIKWVNDVYINDKKACGILVESTCENGRVTNAIVGVGVNITPPKNGFAPEIKDIATSIFEDNPPPSYKEILCAGIINKIVYYYQNMKEKSHMSAYRSNSNIINEEVDIYVGNEIVKGTAIDINDKAEIVVKTENGDIRVFNSGEARVRKSGAKLSEK